MREVGMILDAVEFPIATVIGQGASVEFPFEFFYNYHKKARVKTIRLVHTHPAGATFMSEEDRTTLKAWTMAFAPIPVFMEVITLVDNNGVFWGKWWYMSETFDEWKNRGKEGERRMRLLSHSDLKKNVLDKERVPYWVRKLIELSNY